MCSFCSRGRSFVSSVDLRVIRTRQEGLFRRLLRPMICLSLRQIFQTQVKYAIGFEVFVEGFVVRFLARSRGLRRGVLAS